MIAFTAGLLDAGNAHCGTLRLTAADHVGNERTDAKGKDKRAGSCWSVQVFVISAPNESVVTTAMKG